MRTDLLTDCKAFEDAIRVCDSSHQHLPYTVKNDRFDTSLEAQYPKEFCKLVVQVVQSHFIQSFNGNWVYINNPNDHSKLLWLQAANQLK